MNEIRLEDQIVSDSKIVASEMDDDLVMLSIENGKYYGFNSIGKVIWRLLKDPIKVSDLCKCLQEEFDVDEAQCEVDVLRFLQDLAAQKLVARVNV